MSVQAMELPEITPQVISAIKVPVLLIIGDSDIVTPEHAVAMFRLHSHDDDPALPGRTMSRRVSESQGWGFRFARRWVLRAGSG